VDVYPALRVAVYQRGRFISGTLVGTFQTNAARRGETT